MSLGTSGIVSALESRRFDLSSEQAVQEGVAAVLREAGVDFKREVRLGPGSVIDFLVGELGVEVKLKSSLSAVTRQLHRYAQVTRVGSLLLVTAQLRLCRVPTSLNGKPVAVAALVRSCL
jgi:acyl-CoA thioesterase FadM